MKRALSFAELDASPAGLAALGRFYRSLYVAAFPDRHERESLANMRRYLALKARGWYGANNYHVLLARSGGEVIGGSVFDYLAAPNAGVIEFLFTRADRRRKGFGRALLDATLRILERDARAAGKRRLQAVVAEMNDPFRPAATPDDMDPFERAAIWGGWGFGRLDFPYVQPALSRGQRAVANLALVVKLRPAAPASVDSSWLMEVIAGYMQWAMRIARPRDNAEYRKMARHARRHRQIAVVPLARYVGQEPRLSIEPLHESHPGYQPALRLIAREIPQPGRVASAADFRRALRQRGYHLWGVSRPGGGRGVASFFSLPRAGFGGYIVFDRRLRGRGLLRPLVARVEERMLRDAPRAAGWFVECDRRSMRPFAALGFREARIDYRPPRVGAGASLAPERLRLLYKPFGAAAGAAPSKSFVRACLADIRRAVYGLERAGSTAAARAEMQALRRGESQPRRGARKKSNTRSPHS